MIDHEFFDTKWDEAKRYFTERFGAETDAFKYCDASSWCVGRSRFVQHDTLECEVYICDDCSPFYGLWVEVRMTKDNSPPLIFDYSVKGFEVTDYRGAANYASELADKLNLKTLGYVATAPERQPLFGGQK